MKSAAFRIILASIAISVLIFAFSLFVMRLFRTWSSPFAPQPNWTQNSQTNQSSGNSGKSGNALQLPPVQPDENPAPGEATFTLTAQAGFTQFWPDQATATLGYNGSYLGPILRFRQGEQVRIQVLNELDEPTTVHWHGLVVPGDQDGGPHQIIQPGATWAPEFTVSQPAATLWFHPHAITTTATQVYAGLAGLIYIDDPVSHSLALPQDYGINDFPLIVQDRNFDNHKQFAYQATMMGLVPGETILVNGTLDPYLDVPQDTVRFRILNASNSENYSFQLSDGSDLIQIASDGGLLSTPIAQRSIDCPLANEQRWSSILPKLQKIPSSSFWEVDRSSTSTSKVLARHAGQPCRNLWQPLSPSRPNQTRPSACLNYSPWASPAPSTERPLRWSESTKQSHLVKPKPGSFAIAVAG
ncbi:MAG: multicopper oxidase domain-containing protein [Clostridiales bacterium]|nr:multicopper oxidase domain-containing protein [Clostridiales bacterium]